MNIFLNLDVKLPDRLNFATKLLGEKKRKEFCYALEERLCNFAGLDNILFYLSSKGREEKI
jgi:hypothetical protein